MNGFGDLVESVVWSLIVQEHGCFFEDSELFGKLAITLILSNLLVSDLVGVNRRTGLHVGEGIHLFFSRGVVTTEIAPVSTALAPLKLARV